MQNADVLTKLHSHQARILARIDASMALLPLDPLAARAPLARARWEMIRLMREYQLFKHCSIFDPAIACGDEVQAATARRLKAACLAASEQFGVYTAHWSATDIAAEWTAYCPAMRAMSQAIRSHLARERQQVAMLLASSPHPDRPILED